MANKKNMLELSLTSDTEILLVRTFDGPPELVFEAFTDPNLIPKWWGPKSTTTTVDKMEVRPGGKWRFIQKDKDGEYAFKGEYREIVPNEKIVNTFEFEPMAGHISVENITFEKVDGKTKVTNHVKYASKADRDGMLQTGMEEGAAETWDRFEELIGELQMEKEPA